MRILILNWRDIKHPLAGGAEMVTFEHAKAWANAGHKIYWISSFFKGSKKEEQIEGVSFLRGGEEILGVKFFALFTYLTKFKKRVDLIIDEIHGIPFFTPLYVKEKKLIFIHETAGRVWFLNHFPFPVNFLLGGLSFLVEPWIFRFFYHLTPFLTISQSTKEQLINWGVPKKNITVIHNGIRLFPLKSKPEKESQPTIIFLGALDKDKGIEEAIRAFKIISQQKEQSKFWIVGRSRSSYLKRLKKLSTELKLTDKVKFFGFVSEEKKFELLAKAHLLINPSVKEGWGLVVIEANRVGTPAVVYNVSGLRDSTKDRKTGLICQQNTPQELARNVIKLLEDKKLYQQLQKNALAWSKKFSWEKATQQSLELIENEKNSSW